MAHGWMPSECPNSPEDPNLADEEESQIAIHQPRIAGVPLRSTPLPRTTVLATFEPAPRLNCLHFGNKHSWSDFIGTTRSRIDAGREISLRKHGVLQLPEMGIPLTQVAPTGCGLPLVFPEVG